MTEAPLALGYGCNNHVTEAAVQICGKKRGHRRKTGVVRSGDRVQVTANSKKGTQEAARITVENTIEKSF